MENNFSSFTPSQLPEYLQEQAPLFAGFIKVYYEYASQRNKSIGVIQYHSTESDIDLCSAEYVDNFYATYGEHLPKNIALDRRNLIKLLNSIYAAKGTEKALELLFRALFNETIAITYPSTQILRASDGVWVKEKYITLKTIFGTLPSGDVQLSYTNSNGQFFINSFATDLIDVNTHRVFFKSFSQISIDDGQYVYVYDQGGVVTYTGALQKSPSHLAIISPGKFWQKGQVIVIPGSVQNTTARVKSVTATGGILATEILEYGYIHSDNQISVSSPFPNRPISSTVDINSTIVSVSPIVYHHEISITDIVDNISENIIGVRYGALTSESYFLEDYTDNNDYTGDIVIAKSYTQQAPSQSGVVDPDLTIEEWLESRATFSYQYSNVVDSRGYYNSDSGQISNQQIKLQDNYFYQAFSYLIETNRDIREYSSIFPITHPAGTKRFSNLVKSATFAPVFSSSRNFSADTSYISDLVNSLEYLVINTTKVIIDQVTVSHTFDTIIAKILSDAVTTSDTSTFVFTKSPTTDIVLPEEEIQYVATKTLSDSVTPSEQYSSVFTKSVTTDTTTSSDQATLSAIKYLTDSATASHIESVVTTSSGYADESYFAEQYTELEYIISIG